MTAAFALFMALAIELKAGRISRADMHDRVRKIVEGRYRGEGGKTTPTPLSTAQDRYKLQYLHDSVLNDKVLEAVLCEGKLEPEAINASLAESEYFIKADEELPWQKVWYGVMRDADEFETAFQTMEKQFEERAFLTAPEIMHIMGLRLWCAKIGQLKRTEQEVVAEGKAYIDDLVTRGQLAAEDDLNNPTRSVLRSSFGLGYHEANTPAFKELIQYYLDRRQAAVAARRPGELKEVLSLMSTDTAAFFTALCWTNDERPNTYANVPILALSDPEEFVARMLACHPKDQRTIFSALNERYSHGRLEGTLPSEREWLTKVRENLLASADKTDVPPIRRFAIRDEIETLIDPLLKRSDGA